MLPVYKSKATPSQKEENRQRYYKQFKQIKEQEKDGVPSQFVKIRCGCLKLAHWTQMYRCRYCGIWFCDECAEQHFGYKTGNSLSDAILNESKRVVRESLMPDELEEFDKHNAEIVGRGEAEVPHE